MMAGTFSYVSSLPYIGFPAREFACHPRRNRYYATTFTATIAYGDIIHSSVRSVMGFTLMVGLFSCRQTFYCSILRPPRSPLAVGSTPLLAQSRSSSLLAFAVYMMLKA